MIDWLSSMEQTFEYYTVDPSTWKDVKKLNYVKSCTINRDSESETLGSATIEIAINRRVLYPSVPNCNSKWIEIQVSTWNIFGANTND